MKRRMTRKQCDEWAKRRFQLKDRILCGGIRVYHGEMPFPFLYDPALSTEVNNHIVFEALNVADAMDWLSERNYHELFPPQSLSS